MADSQRKTANLAYDILIKVNDTSQYWNVLYFDADLEPNTTYTLSIDFTSTGYQFYTNGALFTEEVYFNSINGRKSITVTTKSTISKSTASQATDGRWIILKNAINQPSAIQMSNVMLNSDSTALPYEPYWLHSLRKLTTATETVENPLYSGGTAITAYTISGNTVQTGIPTPSNPVEVNGVGVRTENLLDYSTFVNDYWLNNNTGLPQPYNNGGRIATTSSIDVTNVNNVAFNFTSGVENTQFMYSLFNGSTLIERVTGLSRGTTIDVSNGDTLYLCLYGTTGLPITISDVSNAMLNVGSTAKPYEPYGYKLPILNGQQTTNIYLTEQLMKIGDTVDSLASTGTATYTIKKIVFDGKENWEESGTYYRIKLSVACTGRLDFITSHFALAEWAGDIGVNKARFGGNTNDTLVVNYDNGTGGVATFVNWLASQYAAGTPFTIYYVTVTPTTKTVTAPSILTTEGANIITVATTVQPSEFIATWTGWHDASVKEWDGSDWQ